MKTILSSVGRLFVGCFTLLLALTSVKADPLDNWSTNQLASGPPNADLKAVVYGNGQFVAVGQYDGDDNGFVQTSADGVSWTMRSKHDYSILDLYDVAFGTNLYGTNIFVAVGWNFFSGINLYNSTNGIDWSSHSSGLANVFAVAYGDGSFVAVGPGTLPNSGTVTSNVVVYSDDGVNWFSTDSGVPATASPGLNDIAYGNGQFVAVSPGYIYPLFTQARITNSLAGGKISFCKGCFFIPAGPGTNLMSSNGLTWSAVTNNTAATFNHIIYGGGNYVAVSMTNVFSSQDGTNWIQRNLTVSPFDHLVDLTVGNRNILVAGVNGPTAYLSDPFVSLGIGSSFPPQLTLSGLTNRAYRIEAATNFPPANWEALTNITLTNGPTAWTDLQSTNSQRFYRAVLLP
jgi:hypothetical protein